MSQLPVNLLGFHPLGLNGEMSFSEYPPYNIPQVTFKIIHDSTVQRPETASPSQEQSQKISTIALQKLFSVLLVSLVAVLESGKVLK